MMKYYLKRHSMLCIVVLTLWACSGEKVEHQNKEGVETVLPSQPNEVTVMELKAGTFNHELVSNGKVVAMEYADLYFRTGEVIQKIYVENGMNKKVTEPYLVDALSFTEAEARIIEEMTPFISGEFTVSDIKRANYSELFFSDEEAADRWFKCKLTFITLDEKSGAEKKTSTNVLIQAADLRDAVKKLDEGMKGSMADYIISSMAETAIMDVYKYSAEPDVKPEFPQA